MHPSKNSILTACNISLDDDDDDDEYEEIEEEVDQDEQDGALQNQQKPNDHDRNHEDDDDTTEFEQGGGLRDLISNLNPFNKKSNLSESERKSASSLIHTLYYHLTHIHPLMKNSVVVAGSSVLLYLLTRRMIIPNISKTGPKFNVLPAVGSAMQKTATRTTKVAWALATFPIRVFSRMTGSVLGIGGSKKSGIERARLEASYKKESYLAFLNTKLEDRLIYDPAAPIIANNKLQDLSSSKQPDILEPIKSSEADLHPEKNYDINHILRARFFDEYLALYLTDFIVQAEEQENIPLQIVFIGSGLDTRALRLRDHPVQFIAYEVDTPSIIEKKIKALEKIPQATKSHVRWVPSDFTDSTWSVDLVAAGFNPEAKSCWIIEDALFYLKEADIKKLLRTIHLLSNHASILTASILHTSRKYDNTDKKKSMILPPKVSTYRCEDVVEFLYYTGFTTTCALSASNESVQFQRRPDTAAPWYYFVAHPREPYLYDDDLEKTTNGTEQGIRNWEVSQDSGLAKDPSEIAVMDTDFLKNEDVTDLNGVPSVSDEEFAELNQILDSDLVTVKFRLEIPYGIASSGHVYLTGNHIILGNWNVTDGIPLGYANVKSKFELQVKLPRSIGTLEYSYVIVDGNTLTWEGISKSRFLNLTEKEGYETSENWYTCDSYWDSYEL